LPDRKKTAGRKVHFCKEYVLDPDLVDDGIDNIEMGWNGKPFYIKGPYDNYRKIISALNASVGPGGYEYIAEG